MFRELVRKNKEISKEECIEILKSEKRGRAFGKRRGWISLWNANESFLQ